MRGLLLRKSLEVLFLLMFLFIFGVILSVIVGGIVSWNKNNHSPKLTVDAVVAAKRTAHHGGGNTAALTSYYVTFQVESGDRMELSMPGREFGMLAEGDRGRLAFQGSRFLGFARTESRF